MSSMVITTGLIPCLCSFKELLSDTDTVIVGVWRITCMRTSFSGRTSSHPPFMTCVSRVHFPNMF